MLLPNLPDDMAETVDTYGWTGQICKACSAIEIYGHPIGKSSGTLLGFICHALDNKGYTCDGQLTSLTPDDVERLFQALNDAEHIVGA